MTALVVPCKYDVLIAVAFYKPSVWCVLPTSARALLSGEYWPEIVVVRAKRSEVRTKTTKGHYNIARALVLSNSYCVIMNQISMDARPCSIK